MSKSNFNEYRFKGFEVKDRSNKYLKISTRINDTEDKVIVRYSTDQVFVTPYGYGLRIDHDKGIWLKPWQVSEVWDENLGISVYEIVLDKNFTKVATFQEDESIQGDDDFDYANIWESMKAVAEEQEETVALWAKK